MRHYHQRLSVYAAFSQRGRGYHGTYHQFSTKHLRRYVDEFTFRLNDGNVRRPTMARIGALCDKAANKRLTYEDLTA